MQRMIPHVRGLLAAALVAAAAPSLAASDPALYAADSAKPGSVLQVVITGDRVEGISLSLDDSRDRTLSRAEGFRWRTPTGRSVSVVLLGIRPPPSLARTAWC